MRQADIEKARLDRALDEALEQSFPASDPPAILRSGGKSIVLASLRRGSQVPHRQIRRATNLRVSATRRRLTAVR
jgi:hypothetical protein